MERSWSKKLRRADSGVSRTPPARQPAPDIDGLEHPLSRLQHLIGNTGVQQLVSSSRSDGVASPTLVQREYDPFKVPWFMSGDNMDAMRKALASGESGNVDKALATGGARPATYGDVEAPAVEPPPFGGPKPPAAATSPVSPTGPTMPGSPAAQAELELAKTLPKPPPAPSAPPVSPTGATMPGGPAVQAELELAKTIPKPGAAGISPLAQTVPPPAGVSPLAQTVPPNSVSPLGPTQVDPFGQTMPGPGPAPAAAAGADVISSAAKYGGAGLGMFGGAYQMYEAGKDLKNAKSATDSILPFLNLQAGGATALGGLGLATGMADLAALGPAGLVINSGLLGFAGGKWLADNSLNPMMGIHQPGTTQTYTGSAADKLLHPDQEANGPGSVTESKTLTGAAAEQALHPEKQTFAGPEGGAGWEEADKKLHPEKYKWYQKPWLGL